MKANCYKDGLAEAVRSNLRLSLLLLSDTFQEDAIKPVLDLVTERMVKSLSGDARTFFDQEFSFIHEVTSISGKLKSFIKKTKPEKKVCCYIAGLPRSLTCLHQAKIDEEMAKIKVEAGVYLPSHPDRKVVDVDKKSGRPLQSHAKVIKPYCCYGIPVDVSIGTIHGNV
jgi:phosphatidylinositol 4-kinase